MTKIMYALLKAPLPGLTTMLLLTESHEEVCDYARNWAIDPMNRSLNSNAERYLMHGSLPPPSPDGRRLTNFKDGLILHTYEVIVDQPVINIINP
jgi:hypothetical protein